VGHIADVEQSTVVSQKCVCVLQLSPATQSVSARQTAVHSAFTHVVPAGQSYSNWQVVGSAWHVPSTQRSVPVQSLCVRHWPGLRGTHVSRKSHQKPFVQFASLVHVVLGSHEPLVAVMSHIVPGSQSPCVSHTRWPGTQAMFSQCSLLAHCESCVHVGAWFGWHVPLTHIVPTGQVCAASHATG